MEQHKKYSESGYLHEDFRLFHLKDDLGDEKDYHYHTFDKVVVFISGKVNYLIEGITYPLQPWDMLLISHHTLHKAYIDKGRDYERMILYISPEFIAGNITESSDLMACFKTAEHDRFYLLRPDYRSRAQLERTLGKLEREQKGTAFGADIAAKSAALEFLVELNRASLERDGERPAVSYDPKIAAVITYINENLDGELSVSALSQMSYMSKYHFMRRFKELTGYTVHNYILQRRLLHASDLIKSGASAAQAAADSGFCDYSTFQRAFKKMFGTTPAKIKTDR